MNSDSLFREVLESHEFRSSDKNSGCFLSCRRAYLNMSDNANLLDISENFKAGRFMCYLLVESAATM
jgi:hypothetical protein